VSIVQGFPHTLIVLVSSPIKVAVSPAAVIVYGHPPWKEHDKPDVLSVTVNSLVSYRSIIATNYSPASDRDTSLLPFEAGTNLIEGEAAAPPTGIPWSKVADIDVASLMTAESLSTPW